MKGSFLSRVQFDKDPCILVFAILIEKYYFYLVQDFLMITVGPQVFHILHPNWKQSLINSIKMLKCQTELEI